MVSYRARVTFGLLVEAGLRGRARLRNVKVDGGTRLCISLASNMSESAMKLPPQEEVNKLKELLGIDGPPKWYEYSG
jgi:hypothetical protein